MRGWLEARSDTTQAMGEARKRMAARRSTEERGLGRYGDWFPVLIPLLLGVLWRGKHVEIGTEGVKVSKGLRRYFVRIADIVAVFTTMTPRGKDFHEVLAVEFVTGADGGVLALDPSWGFDLAEAMAALQEALGDRWEEVYLGHKHASQVRGL